MITVLSYGAGQDSHAILTKLIFNQSWKDQYIQGQLIVVFADTENEHPHTYKHLELAKKLCAENEIPFLHLGRGYRAASWKEGLVYQWESKIPGIGSKAYPKSCTDNLKVQPIYRALAEYLESCGYGEARLKKSLYAYTERHGQLRVLIGISKGEEKRVAKPSASRAKWMTRNIQIEYPLLEQGMNRNDCQQYLESMESTTGIPCPMPSNCVFCPFNEGFDLVWLHRNEPEMLSQWIKLEAQKLEADRDGSRGKIIASDKSLGVWGKPGVTLSDKLQEALEEYGDMSDDQLNQYKYSHGHCVASAY